ncbi:MAG TPA: nucleotidyltransferase domain-containing protein [Ignavibacteria bacterium]|jgi:hypothetical protein
MLEKSQIISFLRENIKLLRDKYGVVDIGLIGSYARDEQKEDSDIDFLVEFIEVKYDFLADLTIFLEKRFGKKIDIVINDKYLKKSFLTTANRNVIHV